MKINTVKKILFTILCGLLIFLLLDFDTEEGLIFLRGRIFPVSNDGIQVAAAFGQSTPSWNISNFNRAADRYTAMGIMHRYNQDDFRHRRYHYGVGW